MENPSVLVLDDESGITMLCKRLLTRAGFDVSAYTEPRKAMEELAQRRFDLLLVDIRMPEVDGFDVISHAKQNQPNMAVLVMTGYGTVETAIHALRQGVDGLLLKPFERSEELLTAVRQALSDRQKKTDAARIQTLRPLFAVSEALFSETNPARLLERSIETICKQLSCELAGFHEIDPLTKKVKYLAGRGIVPFGIDQEEPPDSGRKVIDTETPLLINAIGPGEPALQTELIRQGMIAAMFVPVNTPGKSSLVHAGRESGQAPFREADLEMFQILARQASVALENARLYEELRGYIRKVEDSQQALLQAEKMAATGRLTASIAHEINNPLQAVQNCMHLAGREDLEPEKRAEYFEMARSELDRLRTTVQRMLDFYRPKAAAPQAVNLAELLKHVLGLMSNQLEERNIQLKLDVRPDLPLVHAVNSQIQQVFLNLILNAYDAMPGGGVLRITGREAKDGVEMLIQDSGPGISAEESQKIFEPFMSTKEGGTGLGLTVSYNIVSSHGGVLELVPTSEPGACFCVYLPSGGEK
jgi:signal transduction histidine kinase/CheY-like chemotaxis protein